MLTTVSALAAASVAAVLITGTRVVGWKNIKKHATKWDVGFTIGIGALLYGTMTGMLVAILGGLIMALVLTVARGIDNMKDRAAAVFKRNRNTDPIYDLDPSEFNSDGEWVYNTGVYTR